MSITKKAYFIDRRFGGVDLCAYPVVDDQGKPLPDQEVRYEDDPVVQAVLHPAKINIEVPMFYFKRYANKYPLTLQGVTLTLLEWIERSLTSGTDAHFDWHNADRIGSQDRDVVAMATALGLSDEQRLALFREVAATVGKAQ